METATLVLQTLFVLPTSWVAWIAPVVVVAIEVPIYIQHFQSDLMSALRDVLVINVASAVAGFVLCLSPWLQGAEQIGAQVLIGWLVIAWILSTLIEWWVASAFQREMTSGEVFMWSLQANGVSYLCLGGLVVIGSLVRS